MSEPLTRRQVVIVGHGMAGHRLATAIRDRDPHGRRIALTVLGAEPHRAYNRVLLSTLLAGSLSPDQVTLHDTNWAANHHIDLRLSCTVTGLERPRRRVRLGDGSSIGYDTLVLATGARPSPPPIEGLHATLTPGDSGDRDSRAPMVSALRSLDDATGILAAVRPGAPVVVLGGGLLGLEAAAALAARGAHVTVVHPHRRVAEHHLDAGASRVLIRALSARGITVRLGARVAAWLPGGVAELTDGTRLPATLLLLATGVRPDTTLAGRAGLAVERGVLVDDTLETSDPDIRAIGDCAQHRGAPPGLVAPAFEQAAVLADRLTGTKSDAGYRGTRAITRLKAPGLDVTSFGEIDVGIDDPHAEVLRHEDPTASHYAKLVLRDARITGGVFCGGADAAATLAGLYDREVPAPADRLALLHGRALPAAATEGGPAGIPPDTVICRCNTVTKRQLVTAFHGGARDTAALAATTRAATGCGGCSDSVTGIVDWLTNEHTATTDTTTPRHE